MSENGHFQPGQLTRDDLEILAAYGAQANWLSGFALYERGAAANGLFVVSGRIVLSNSGRNKRDFVSWVAFERKGTSYVIHRSQPALSPA
ncbi:MAG: hypothetical protein ABIV11_11115 [Gemmatimonadaceae bacterium]